MEQYDSYAFILKQPLHTHNQKSSLLRESVEQGKNENTDMGKKIDLQTLRQQIQEFPIDKELKHDLLEAISDKKRYGLVWEESEEEAQEIMQEYLPVFKEDESKRLDSVPEGSPNHVLIEGDNLNALTALTYTHAGKIDVIYIDPPYNTGNKDFVYNDSFVDKEDGYRHSKWLSFMDKR